MAVKAYFDFQAIGRNVKFFNLSTGDAGAPDTFAWDFGFAAPAGVSTVENPIVDFPADGVYDVKFTATKGSESNTLEVHLVITNENRINLSIRDLIQGEVPSSMDVRGLSISQLIKSWQLFLQPLIETPYEIIPGDTFSEEKWPSLANVLVAKLVILDLIYTNARKAALSSQGTTKGALKRLETGPSVAEWYDGSAFWTEMLKQDGYIQSLINEVCLLGSSLGITLPMCQYINKPELFIVGKKCKPSYPCNPWQN